MTGLNAFRAAALGVVLWCAPAQAQDSAAIREMMDVSGMTEQFAGLGDNFLSGIGGMGQQSLPPELLEELARIAARHIDSADSLRAVETGLEATLSPEQVADVTTFYQSPLGVRLKEAEVAASTDAAVEDQMRRQAALRAELEKDPERLALARAYDEAILGSQLTATISVSVAQAILIGGIEAQHEPVDRQRLAAVEQQLAAMHGQIVAEIADLMLANFAEAYRSFSNEELSSYLEFMKTESARATYASVFEAIHTFLSERSLLIGKEFGALVRQKRA